MTAIDSEATSIQLSPEDHRFELKDISIWFLEGELSVITGLMAASGESAYNVKFLPFNPNFTRRRLC